MFRFSIYVASVLFALTLCTFAAMKAHAGAAQDAVSLQYVKLQATTPGTPQTGHINITGTTISGQFRGGGAGLTGVPWSSLTGVPNTLLALPYSGTSATSGTAFAVANTDASGTGIALSGTSSAGTGVTGTSNASGAGVDGSTNGGIGVRGSSNTGNGGSFLSQTGNSGVLGFNYGSGYGVKGVSNTNYGGYFTTTSGGAGLYGYGASVTGVKGGSTSNYGVYGESAVSVGVYGYGASNTGTYGQTDSTSNACSGVVGWAPHAGAWGVYSVGPFGASGTKSFRIDHPADPLHKYLLHYCSEGPEPFNVYSGNVTTDAHGAAWVQLPSYFTEINKDPRYQLTVVDDSAAPGFVQVKVAKKINAAGKFMILTSAPNIEVSWRIEAVRNDRWVQKYGARWSRTRKARPTASTSTQNSTAHRRRWA